MTDRATDPLPAPSPATSVWLLLIAPVVVVVVPIVVAVIRAAATGWLPIGDDAYFTARSRDVLTEHHPLLGAWSSGSAESDQLVNNLGPLQLDLLAPFTKVSPGTGTAVGVGAVHVATIVTIAWLVCRLGGRRAVAPAMAAVGLLTWTLGSELLITPQQHQFLVLPFLCFLVAAWAATAGDRWALVPAVVAASLCTQTHLTYPILVVAVAIVVAVGQVGVAVDSRRRGVSDAGARPFAVAGGLALALWAQTLYDQFAGWGNLGDVLFAPGDTDAAGPRAGLRIVAGVLTAPRFFLRGYREFDPATVGGAASAVVFLLVVAAAGAALVVSVRARRTTVAAGLAVALAVVGAGIVDAALLPVTAFGLLDSNYRWLWPIGTFLLLGALVGAGRWMPTRCARAAWAAVAVVTVVASAANLPESLQVANPAVYRQYRDDVADLVAQVRAVPLDGPVIVDDRSMYFSQPFTYPLLVALQVADVEFRLHGPVQQRRFGDGRAIDGTEAARLVLTYGPEAVARRTRPDAIATVDTVETAVAVTVTLEAP